MRNTFIDLLLAVGGFLFVVIILGAILGIESAFLYYVYKWLIQPELLAPPLSFKASIGIIALVNMIASICKSNIKIGNSE
jgi:hypothetical protein